MNYPATPSSVLTYTYGNPNWPDQATQIGEQALTYDTVGNLTYDGAHRYTWTARRQLTRMEGTRGMLTFAYDENGLRTKKTVNGTETEYTYHEGRLVHLKTGNGEMHFYYDEMGRPGMVRWDGKDYLYAYNIQGDVIGLTDSVTMHYAVSYAYDEWDAMKTIRGTGSLGSTLGRENPFRYRGMYTTRRRGFTI